MTLTGEGNTVNIMVSMGNVLKRFKEFVVSVYIYMRGVIRPSEIKTGKDIPIIINNYNRLTCMLLLIKALTDRGYHNIYIIDNKSTWPPLIKYYNSCPYPVFRLNENMGFKALWKCRDLRKRFCCDYYIYTDPDVVPSAFCPGDFIDYFFSELKKHPLARKTGFSLRIDNLPDHYGNKEEVIAWEQQFYTRLNKDNLYRAPIDTTFALYRPYAGLSRSRYVEAYRTAYPYQAEHFPWYSNTDHPDTEEQYYISHVEQATVWSGKLKKQLPGDA
jgi:hypothetical protein